MSLSNDSGQLTKKTCLPLPQEVVDLILDELILPYDRQTLMAISLTCRQMVYRSRCNLFYEISLSADAPNKIQELFDILSSNICTIPPAAQVVYIWPPRGELAISQIEDVKPRLEQLIPMIVDKLPAVTMLYCIRITSCSIPKMWEHILQSTFISSKITYLGSIRNDFPSVYSLMESLYPLTSLQHFEIDVPNFDTTVSMKSTGKSAGIKPLPSSLRILQINYNSVKPLTESIL